MGNRYATFYEKYIKRGLDCICALMALIILSPVLMCLLIIGTIKMKGNPLFVQIRPGTNEKLFKLIKFRTMTNEKDSKGNLLSDDKRITKYGKFLRKTSLDELPELINIIKGDMSIVGPRPQLVRDIVFMTEEQRKRHIVRQGLTGLAQINGRNNVSWEEKLAYDLKYIEKITFMNDLKIIVTTVIKVIKCKDISSEGMETAQDYGDYLLNHGIIEYEEYLLKQKLANNIIYNI